MILPADEGNAVVIMDRDDYECKVTTMLKDERTYKEVRKTLYHHWRGR